MTPAQQQLEARLADLQARIGAAARQSGRPPQAVTLVAVTKSAPPGIFDLLARAGVRHAGESRVQDAETRLAGREHAFRWHLVGHLQSNKVRRAVALFDVFHGIDSQALLGRVEHASGDLGRRPELLLQVNVSGEASKHGLSPDALPAALDVAATLRHASVTGLMTMAPQDADPERARSTFRALATLRDRCARPDAGLPLAQLSMGMSDDFAVAIEEGATLVRIGRSLVAGLLALLLLLACAAPAAAQAPDDVVPAAIDAALAAPDDPFVFGVPSLAPGKLVFTDPQAASGRCAVDIGDASGDGVADLAVGFAPGTASRTLQARDGRTGAVLWSAAPDDGGFRGFRTLAVRDGALYSGASSVHGRIERRDPATGAPIWARDLQPSGGVPANVLALEPCADVDGDGETDLLVAGGRGIDALLLLSGADGHTLWTHAAGQPVCDVRATSDLDRDGVPDLFACGGTATPFARALSGASGSVLWSASLAGPGSVLLPLPDVDGDGIPEVAVGTFAAPLPTLAALSGADGALRWTSPSLSRNVTSLVAVGDLDADRRADLAVGSFDNAVSAVSSATGLNAWRTEGSTVNGGSMLCVANVGDLDQNGAQDLFTGALDEQGYLLDGRLGVYLATQDLRVRGVATAVLSDGDGDGRREMVFAGDGTLAVLAGNGGIVAGPLCSVDPPDAFGDPTFIYAYAYPTSGILVLLSPSTGSLKLPGFTGRFGLDPRQFLVLFAGTAPGAGQSGYLLDSLPVKAIGLTIHVQLVSVFAPGRGAFSNVVSFIVPG